MPREWYDKHAANKIEDPSKRSLYRSIVADKKPYFMRYIYPALMKQYNTYIKNTERNALREFQMTIDELNEIPIGKTTERQREFLKYYDYRMPVGVHDCVMNKICRRFEQEFDGYIGKHNSMVKFDYTIMRSDAGYTPKQYASIKRLYEDYNKRLASYSVFADYERVDDPTLIGDLRSWNPTSWTSKTVTKNVAGEITLTSRAYYYYQYNNSDLFINPYKSELKFVYSSTPHATVTNLRNTTKIIGNAYDYDFNFVSYNYNWITYHNVASPVEYTIYTDYTAMTTNRILKADTSMLQMTGSVKINGTEHNYSAYVYIAY